MLNIANGLLEQELVPIIVHDEDDVEFITVQIHSLLSGSTMEKWEL